MVTDRMIQASDLPLVTIALAKDPNHSGTEPEFFVEPGTVCKVYEDEKGPILFARGAKALRLDIQYVDNNDTRRNMTAMLEGFDRLAAKAAENGFTEVIFNTNNPLLRRFCIKRFGFVDSCGELRKFI